MSEPIAKQFCRERCALMGEPPCFEIDAQTGDEWEPCDNCAGAVAVHEVATETLRARVRAESAIAEEALRERDEALEKLVEALELALPILDDMRRVIVECHSKLQCSENGEIEPIPGTLTGLAAEEVAEYDKAIAAARTTLAEIRKGEG